MAEQGKKPGEQIKKRPRFSENTEGSGAKRLSIAAVARNPVSTISPAELAAANPVAAMTSTRAAPSPVSKLKPITSAALTSPLAVMPSPVATKSLTLAAPNTVAMADPAPSVAVTSPVAATPPALAAPSPADTRVLAAPSPVSTKTPTPGSVATPKPLAVVKPDEEGAEHNGGAMVAMAAMAAEEEELANIDLPKKLFDCPACRAPLKPPVFKCEKEHFVCCACGGDGDGDGDHGASKRCGPCGHEVSYTHSDFMDGVVGAYKVPCPYKKHGCSSSTIVYHEAADHKARCAHAPCYCLECTPPFEGSPENLLRHLTAPSGKHSWLTDKIRYEMCHTFAVPASSEDHRCLLVAEDGCVFLLAVGAGSAPAGRRPVNVVCVRGNANADARPLYTGVLWVDGPPAAPGQLRCTFRQQATVASCSVPGEVDMEQGWLHAHVNPNMLRGDSGEVHLRLCITKFP